MIRTFATGLGLSGTRALPVVVLAAALAGCGGGAAAPQGPAHVPTPPPVTTTDPLGERPDASAAAPFTPPVPAVYTRADGVTVWLLERRTLPLISIDLVVPAGAASDPQGKGGLAWATAVMLDEGAGKRGALEISRDVDRLGATLHTGAYADYAFVQLTTLKKNLSEAAAIFGDVVVRPTFPASEWKRVSDLWKNDLRSRQSDPQRVADLVAFAKVFDGGPYGHPTSGTLASAAKVTLADVQAFYKARFRPDEATCVVVGDVTRAELDPLLDRAFAGWKAPSPAPAKAAPVAPIADAAEPSARRVVLVDRPDAPQAVVTVAKRGVRAADPSSPLLSRVNAALGGSFTSRLNQQLREERGWTYGARSRFSFNAQRGIFTASAAIQTEHTGEALKLMLDEIDALASRGLTDDEVAKTRLLARADLVEAFEGVDAAGARLARSAGVALPPDHDAKASAVLYAASAKELKDAAATHLRTSGVTVVIVGPRAAVLPQLAAIGLTAIEAAGPEGESLPPAEDKRR